MPILGGSSDLLMGIGIGAVVWFLVQNLILRDAWAIWLARRRNIPGVLLAPALVALAVAGINLVVAFGYSVFQALATVKVEPWVWMVLVVSALVAIPSGVVLWRRTHP